MMKTSIMVLIVGAVLFVGGLALGLGVTMIGMIHTFNSITESGQVPAQQVAEVVSDSVTATAIGMAFSLLGLCLVVGVLIYRFAGRKRCGPKPKSRGIA